MRLKSLYILLFIGVTTVFYLSWLPNPQLGRYGFLPPWLERWADAQVNENIRTAVPLVLLGLLAGCWLAVTRKTLFWWIAGWVLLVGVVFIAEVGQLILPLRHFDWSDVYWGAIGSFGGLVLIATIALIVEIIKQLI